MASLFNARDHVYLIMEDTTIQSERLLMRNVSEDDRELCLCEFTDGFNLFDYRSAKY
ncbi:hypothetical protein [Sphingobacterium sp.]|uniref:hypothetical protein n=1 Tax=Sphingobacterium sp. TaxID=341027 RepID=UPI002899D5DB|nr:hypothetical protein [Sphingobacterium sp.]